MTAPAHATQSVAPPTAGKVFWIVRGRPKLGYAFDRSLVIHVPRSLHSVALSSPCEDWCLDELAGGLRAEWHGLDLFLHFNSKVDAVKFILRWL